MTATRISPDPALAALLQDVVQPGQTELEARWTSDTVQWAARLGLAGALWSRCLLGRVTLSEELQPALQAAALAQQVLSQQQRRALDELETVLSEAGVPVRRLKGAAVRELYPQADDRSMSDLDLLLPVAGLARAHELLLELGYVQESSRSRAFYRKHHHLMPYRHKKTRLCVELHHQLLAPSDLAADHPALSAAALFAESCPPLAGGLPAELQYLHTVLHMTTNLEPRACVTGLLDLQVLSRAGRLRERQTTLQHWVSDPLLARRFAAVALAPSPWPGEGAVSAERATRVLGPVSRRALAAAWDHAIMRSASTRTVERHALQWMHLTQPGPAWLNGLRCLLAWTRRALCAIPRRLRWPAD